MKGIDVSVHNGVFPWGNVKNEIDFAILRAGYGRLVSQKDKQFENNYAGCKANGIPVGAYQFSYAENAEEAKQEAEIMLEWLKGKTFEFPIALDLEDDEKESRNKNRRKNANAIITAYREILEKEGYFVALYASKSWLESYVSLEIRNNIDVWVAHYTKNEQPTTYKNPYGIWQFTSTNGHVPSFKGDLDVNYAYKDYPTIIKNGGFNGFSKQPIKPIPPAPKKSNDEIAKEVIDGKWGNGNDRKTKLSKAGYDYNTIQSIVNKLIAVTPPKKSIVVGARVKVLKAVQYDGNSFKIFRDWYDVIQIQGDRVVIGVRGEGVTAAVNISNIEVI
jgi:GH25 family lysozyme M1 (1,4-beta-N-acetylmuramidase)